MYSSRRPKTALLIWNNSQHWVNSPFIQRVFRKLVFRIRSSKSERQITNDEDRIMAHVRGFFLLLFYAVTNSKRGLVLSMLAVFLPQRGEGASK